MCIIANEVKHISNTQILIGINRDKNIQYTIYSNNVENEVPNAMILPVPYPQSVKFHDLSLYENLFRDCEYSFPRPQKLTLSPDTKSATKSATKILEVISVGSYKVSLAMTLSDIKLVDKTIFVLDDECEKVLQNYPDNFGFVICVLDIGKESYHPFGYSHQIMEEGKIFIPTKHFHKHSYKNGIFGKAIGVYNDYMANDWDHDIYLCNCALDTGIGKYTWNGFNHLSKIKLMWANIHFDKMNWFEKIHINGTYKNVDLYAEIVSQLIQRAKAEQDENGKWHTIFY